MFKGNVRIILGITAHFRKNKKVFAKLAEFTFINGDLLDKLNKLDKIDGMKSNEILLYQFITIKTHTMLLFVANKINRL